MRLRHIYLSNPTAKLASRSVGILYLRHRPEAKASTKALKWARTTPTYGYDPHRQGREARSA